MKTAIPQDARRRLLSAAAAALFAMLGAARAGDPSPATAPRLPFSDDVAPPPPLAKPIDRAFRGELVDFDGERVTLRWDWKSPAHLADFESFVPVRSTLTGGFSVKGGRLYADGTAGIRLRLGMLSDLEVHVPAVLTKPHDLGVVLALPGVDDDSVLCLVQDTLFTAFDAAAGRSNMINRLGGIPVVHAGFTEFRYIARNLVPRLDPGANVQFDVVRKPVETSFSITPKDKEACVLRGKDTTPLARVTPGLYVSGGTADFGTLTISGKIDPQWCADHGVLPHLSANLLDPANKWKPAEKKAAELVEKFAKEDPATAKNPKSLVAPEAIAPFIGDVKLPLVIRIRAAEAILDRGATEGAVGERLAALLDAKDEPTRVLAWQVMRPRLPWHFKYEVGAPSSVRREAALLIGAWVREHADAEKAGKVFVEGSWHPPQRADQIRSYWDHAWDLRTPRIRLKTDLSKEKADWYLAALEAEYVELVRLVGREPPAQCLPMSAFVFSDKADFAAFCAKNGYEAKSAWGRFTDLDKNVSFTSFDAKDGLANALGQFAKQFHHFATGRHWPVWYDEGRAAWFGSAEYGTASFDGATLKVGLRGQGASVEKLKLMAAQTGIPPIVDVVSKDPRNLDGDARRIWYVEAWAFHAWLIDAAPDEIRGRFAEWQSAMGKLPTSPSDVDETGRKEFLLRFEKDLPEMDRLFKEWVIKL
jgi:hypothetical protein